MDPPPTTPALLTSMQPLQLPWGSLLAPSLTFIHRVLDANLTQQRGLGARLGSTVYSTCPGFFSWLHHHLWGAVRIDALPGPAQDRLLSSKFSTLEMQPPQGPLLGGLELLLRLDLAGTPPPPPELALLRTPTAQAGTSWSGPRPAGLSAEGRRAAKFQGPEA